MPAGDSLVPSGLLIAAIKTTICGHQCPWETPSSRQGFFEAEVGQNWDPMEEWAICARGGKISCLTASSPPIFAG